MVPVQRPDEPHRKCRDDHRTLAIRRREKQRCDPSRKRRDEQESRDTGDPRWRAQNGRHIARREQSSPTQRRGAGHTGHRADSESRYQRSSPPSGAMPLIGMSRGVSMPLTIRWIIGAFFGPTTSAPTKRALLMSV